MTPMTQTSGADEQRCLFCAIGAGQSEASVVSEDDAVVAFMALRTMDDPAADEVLTRDRLALLLGVLPDQRAR